MASFGDEFVAEFRTPLPFLVWAGLTLIVGLSGPFGSYAILPVVQRFAFWGLAIAFGIVVGVGCRSFVRSVLGWCDTRQAMILTAALACMLLSAPLYALVHLVLDQAAQDLPGVIEVVVFTFSASLAAAAFRNALDQTGSTFIRDERAAAPVLDFPPVPDPPQLPRLVQRMEPMVQGKLVSISVRDHYVDVMTVNGQASLLLRFSDAMAEAEGVAGVQIHRSHWVAWDAIDRVEKADGKVFVVTLYGARLPVSRNHRLKLEDRGLL